MLPKNQNRREGGGIEIPGEGMLTAKGVSKWFLNSDKHPIQP